MLEHSVFVKLDNFNGIEPFYDSVTVLSCLKRMCVMFIFCAPVISPPFPGVWAESAHSQEGGCLRIEDHLQ